MPIVNPSLDDHSTHSDFKTKTAKPEYNETKCWSRYNGVGYFKVCMSQADLDKAEEVRVKKKADRAKILERVNNAIEDKGYALMNAEDKKMYHSFKSQEARTKVDVLEKQYVDKDDADGKAKQKEDRKEKADALAVKKKEERKVDRKEDKRITKINKNLEGFERALTKVGGELSDAEKKLKTAEKTNIFDANHNKLVKARRSKDAELIKKYGDIEAETLAKIVKKRRDEVDKIKKKLTRINKVIDKLNKMKEDEVGGDDPSSDEEDLKEPKPQAERQAYYDNRKRRKRKKRRVEGGLYDDRA